jgi:hypothetical protein
MLKNMQRVQWVGADFNEPAWGLAYGTLRLDGKTVWGHGGFCPGAPTEFIMRLPTKVGVVMMVSVNDVSPGAMVETIYSLTEAAIAKAYGKKVLDTREKSAVPDGSKDDNEVNLSDYEGSYHVVNYAADNYIGVNQDGLFAIPIFSNDPVGNMQTWVHEEGDTFRRKRADDTLAEAITFERDADGDVSALVQHSYRSINEKPQNDFGQPLTSHLCVKAGCIQLSPTFRANRQEC